MVIEWKFPVKEGFLGGMDLKLPELKIGHLTARLPIVQGGMSVRVSMAKLAAAVAEAGGIGTIGGVGMPLDELKAEIRKAKEMTKGIIAVNIMFAARTFMDTVKASIEAGVDMIATGAGFSREIYGVAKEAGVPVVSIVSSPGFAQLAERCGASAIVVEATEAGGHLGTDRKLRDLFPEVRKVVSKVPLIAAGGITDGADIAEIMGKFGADGVQMATRFVLTEECDVAPGFKQAYLGAKEEDIVVMQSPVGMPGRAIRNKFLRDLEAAKDLFDGSCDACLKSCSHTFCILSRLNTAHDGDTEDGLVFTGANVWRIKDVPKVSDLMKRLVDEAEALYNPEPSPALS